MSYPPNISFWEIKQYLQDIDLLIVGSGIVGLTTAIFQKNAHPKKRVVIIEKGFLPAGASTKNAGFACFGSPSEVLSDLKKSSEEDVFQVIQQRFEGLNALRELLGDKNMNYEACGGFEVFKPNDNELFEKCMAFIEEANRKLKSKLGIANTYTLENQAKNEFGFDGVNHLIKNNYEGAIDTGMMMNSLLKMASDLGIIILNGLEVSSFSQSGTKMTVYLTNGLTIPAQHVHVANNGFAKQLLPELNVTPARAQVLITTPIKQLQVKGTFHMNEGFYYFRNVGNQVLLGGGRELDIENETNSELEITELIQNRLDNLLKTVILPNTDFEIEHRWAGIMGVGESKKPIVKHISSNLSCSVRLGGMGVAIGTSIGKQSAIIIG